ncbi:hypothetical protein LTR47_000646 [Exophiala xenobiotica]|nr:hypothetical protein LTR41_006941 [Exophiala xenobiotica]KAK5228025.1 hypothetical protein LTR72_001908 [Exophiala xenobiotica]KAK5238903.1 hypothetical protein LTR47_000646 [Exophiala xenobiotica]KAK5255825.1 hypothetical protein LTS06_000281 [Exophiala xenobiotica]KAK5282650.1 hypothetical protein LTR40_002989 [Exophiala xenobiotica]
MLNGNPEKDPSAVKLGDFGLGLIVDNDAAYSTMESETDSSPRIPHSFSDALQKCVESCLAFKPIRRKGLLSLLQHAKSRVSFDSDDLLIQVKEDIAPKGPDQHSRTIPRQPITGNALTLTYTPFEATSPGTKPTDDTKTDITTESSVLNEFREFRRGRRESPRREGGIEKRTELDFTTESSILNEFREFRRQRRESPRREGGTEKRTELDITTESSVPFKWWWQKKEEQSLV